MTDWDRPLARRWAVALAVGCLLPLPSLGITGDSQWIWPWDVAKLAKTGDAFILFLPLALALAVFVVLRTDSGRARGGWLLGLAASTILGPMLLSQHGFFSFEGPVSFADPILGAFVPLALAFGAVAVAAGNREAKAELQRGAGSWIAGVGGLAILGSYFVPVQGISLIGFLTKVEFWKSAWWLGLWMVGLAVYAVCGALLLLPLGAGQGVRSFAHVWTSRLARSLAWLLPALLVAAAIIEGGTPDLTGFLVSLTKGILVAYGTLILMAVGLARMLQGDPARAVVADAFD